ncbi:MAG: Uma2 family endonuclease [Caldilineaceae bacterium]|nr:Uma2 family endonuclease [Caldilineaceae bacterium]
MPTKRPVPPLENGDRLTQAEFHRRYVAMRQVKKVELIEGVVHMPSPIRRSHASAHAAVMGALFVYAAATPDVEVGDNATVFLDMDNEVQPDALLRLAVNGASLVNANDYIQGPPELIVEIAGTSAAYDLHAKKHVYRRSGVQEYAIWVLYDNDFLWFRLVEGEYMRIQPDETGVIRSVSFPGLWINVPALLAGELSAVLQTVQHGLADESNRETTS